MTKPQEKLEITKQKLITATLNILNERGQDYKSLTSRDIASRAGVPLGMINYCFGSKDDLVLKVFLDSYENHIDKERVVDYFAEECRIKDPREKLKVSAFKFVKFFMIHGDCIRDVLKYVITSYDPASLLKAYPLIREIMSNDVSDEECKLMAYELGSIMQLAVLRKDDFKKSFNIDFDDDEQLKSFINKHVDKIVCK